MKHLALAGAALIALTTAASADFLTDHQGTWFGEGNAHGEEVSGVQFNIIDRKIQIVYGSVGCASWVDIENVYGEGMAGHEAIETGDCTTGYEVMVTQARGGNGIEFRWMSNDGPAGSVIARPE